MTEEIDVKEFIGAGEIADDMRFVEAELNDAMMKQSSLMAYYGARLGEAQFQVDKFKMLLDIKEAQTAERLRDAMAEEGKKVTEKLLEQKVATSPTVIKYKIALNKSKRVYETIRGAMEGLRAKKDMLIQFGVRHRMEMEQQSRVSHRDQHEMLRQEAERAGKEGVNDTVKRLREKRDAA
jgi:hypothetical protein